MVKIVRDGKRHVLASASSRVAINDKIINYYKSNAEPRGIHSVQESSDHHHLSFFLFILLRELRLPSRPSPSRAGGITAGLIILGAMRALIEKYELAPPFFTTYMNQMALVPPVAQGGGVRFVHGRDLH